MSEKEKFLVYILSSIRLAAPLYSLSNIHDYVHCCLYVLCLFLRSFRLHLSDVLVIGDE
jgi:hypothetical protein